MLPATARIHTRVTSKRRMEEDLLLRRGGGASNIMFLLFWSHIGSQVLPTDMLVDVSSKLVQVGRGFRGTWLQVCKPNLCSVSSHKHPLVFQFSSHNLQTSMLSTIVSSTKNIGLTFVISSRSTLKCSLRLGERCLHPFKHSLEEFGDCISNLGRDGVAAWGESNQSTSAILFLLLLWPLVLDLVLVSF